MSSPEVPRDLTNETVANPVADVYARCLDDVQRGLLDAQAQREAGESTVYGSYDLDSLVADMAEGAADAGDIAQTEAYIDTLFKIPEASKYTRARACFSGIKAGSQHASNMLRGALEAEKLKAQQDAIAHRDEFPHSLRPYVSVDLLMSVTEVCDENGTPPDGWIEEYALDKEWRWKLYMTHYSRLANADGSDAPIYQERLHTTAAELLKGDAFPTDFAYKETWYSLHMVKDVSLRERLVHRFIQSAKEVPLTFETFNTLVWVGSTVLQDADLASSDTIGFFERTIERCAQLLQEDGVDAYSLAETQLSWRTNLKRYYGASPQEIIDSIDLQISQLLSSDIPEWPDPMSSTVLRNKEYVTTLRDGKLEDYADCYAEQGDFAAARLFLSNIVNESRHEQAVKECLAKATDPEQVALIRPDELTLAFNPDAELPFTITEARLAGDNAKLRDLACVYAKTITESNHYRKRGYIQGIYETLFKRDPQQAMLLATEILGTLRNAGEPYDRTSYLSNALIQAGDAEEPQNAYEDIHRSSRSESSKLLRLWELASLLKQQMRP